MALVTRMVAHDGTSRIERIGAGPSRAGSLAARPPEGHLACQEPAIPAVDILWITAGLGCDGDSISITAATQPSLEDILLGAIPGCPRLRCTIRCCRSRSAKSFWRPSIGRRRPAQAVFLVVEGSIPDETNKAAGYWAGFGTDAKTGQPITTCHWIDRLVPHAWAVVACGTCATSAASMPWRATQPVQRPGRLPGLGLAVVGRHSAGLRARLSGAAGQFHGGGAVLAQPGGRPLADDSAGQAIAAQWLFEATVHEGCDRGGYYEQADFAGKQEAGSPKCIVKMGCWGPVVQCNVGKRGWMNGIGGCPNVGGVCIGCTMPGFPISSCRCWKSRPEPLSTTAVVMYGKTVRALWKFTRASLNREPAWRTPWQEPDAAVTGKPVPAKDSNLSQQGALPSPLPSSRPP